MHIIDALVASLVEASASSDSTEFDALRRGVRIRSVLSPAVYSDPQLEHHLQSARLLGEEVRVAPELQTKMLIIDARTLIVPVRIASDEQVRALISDSPHLTASLQNVFDLVCQSATPVVPLSVPSQRESTPTLCRS